MSIHRREWLKVSAGCAAGMAVAGLSGQTASAQRSTSVNDQISLAAIGCGGRAGYLLNLMASHQDVAITTLCDVNSMNLDRTATAIQQLQGRRPRVLGDFRLLLEDKSIDAVVVATPHHWHTPIAVRALDAGKHVYLEKPASHVFHEGRLLIQAARRSGRVLQHGTQMRSSEVTAAAGEVLRSGLLGEIKQSKAWGVEPRPNGPEPVADSQAPANLDYDFWLGPAPARPFNENRFRRWNSYRDYGNGEIGGDGIHDIDMARWGLGVTTHPIRVSAIGSRAQLRGEGEFPDNLTAIYEYADGRTLIYENRNFAPYKMHGWDNGNLFYGTEGYMVFSRRGYFQTYLGADEAQGPGLSGSAGNEQHVRNFLDAVRERQTCNTNAEIAHLSCGIVHLGEIAYRTRRTLEFDPDREQFASDDEANAMLTKPHRAPWTFS